MSSKRKFEVADEKSDDEGISAVATFNKYKKKKESETTNEFQANPSIDNVHQELPLSGTSSSKANESQSSQQGGSQAGAELTPNNKVNLAPKMGKTFAQTFAFLKNTDMYKLPPEPVKVATKPVLKNTNAIIVNPRQRGNPILKHVRNVPWEYGEIVPDYEIGKTHCALFLSLRYHNLNPDYIHERLKALGNQYDLRVLLVQVDKNCQHSLKSLGKIAMLAGCTLILAWSPEEAGRYLETYKQYEHKPPDVLLERVETDYLSKAQDILTSIKSINKTDVITLLSTFGSLKNIVNASIEEIELCPGFGPQKANRLHKVFQEPFKRIANIVTSVPDVATSEESNSRSECKLKRPGAKSSPHKCSPPSKLKRPNDKGNLLPSNSSSNSSTNSNKSVLEKSHQTDSKFESSSSNPNFVESEEYAINGDNLQESTTEKEDNEKLKASSTDIIDTNVSNKGNGLQQSVKLSATLTSEPVDVNFHVDTSDQSVMNPKRTLSFEKSSLSQTSYKISKSEAINKSGLSRTRKDSLVNVTEKENNSVKLIQKPQLLQNEKTADAITNNLNATHPKIVRKPNVITRSPARKTGKVTTKSSATRVSISSFGERNVELIGKDRETASSNVGNLSTELTNEEYNDLLASDDSEDGDAD